MWGWLCFLPPSAPAQMSLGPWVTLPRMWLHILGPHSPPLPPPPMSFHSHALGKAGAEGSGGLPSRSPLLCSASRNTVQGCLVSSPLPSVSPSQLPYSHCCFL